MALLALVCSLVPTQVMRRRSINIGSHRGEKRRRPLLNHPARPDLSPRPYGREGAQLHPGRSSGVQDFHYPHQQYTSSNAGSPEFRYGHAIAPKDSQPRIQRPLEVGSGFSEQSPSLQHPSSHRILFFF